MYYDDDLNRMWLEAEFLAIVSELVPRVCRALYEGPFRLYKEMGPYPPPTWAELKYKAYIPQVKALQESIEAWARPKLTAEWCKEAAYFTLEAWVHSSKPGEFFWHPGVTRIKTRHLSTEGLPLYRPEFGPKVYLKEIKRAAREAIINHPLLKLANAEQRLKFIDAIVASRAVKAYCKDVEAAQKPVTSKERRKPRQHLEWAVRVHVKGEKQVAIFREMELDGRAVTAPAISLAVSDILNTLNLTS